MCHITTQVRWQNVGYVVFLGIFWLAIQLVARICSNSLQSEFYKDYCVTHIRSDEMKSEKSAGTTLLSNYYTTLARQ